MDSFFVKRRNWIGKGNQALNEQLQTLYQCCKCIATIQWNGNADTNIFSFE